MAAMKYDVTETQPAWIKWRYTVEADSPEEAQEMCAEGLVKIDQGGSPESIEICEHLGLDFVSAPLSQLPGARLAAAQARLRGKK